MVVLVGVPFVFHNAGADWIARGGKVQGAVGFLEVPRRHAIGVGLQVCQKKPAPVEIPSQASIARHCSRPAKPRSRVDPDRPLGNPLRHAPPDRIESREYRPPCHHSAPESIVDHKAKLAAEVRQHGRRNVRDEARTGGRPIGLPEASLLTISVRDEIHRIPNPYEFCRPELSEPVKGSGAYIREDRQLAIAANPPQSRSCTLRNICS